MTERDHPEPLEVQIERKFKHLTDTQLIARLEAAEPFHYDDEQYELNRRLAKDGKTWRWDGDRVEVIDQPLSDEQRINRGIESAGLSIVSDTVARIIASQWHGGQGSELYSFASTGRISLDDLQPEIYHSYLTATEDERVHLEALSLYLLETGDREAVEGWHESTKWGSE